MIKPGIAVLHYTAPPVIGGVEAVIDAHAKVFLDLGYPVRVIAGRGEAAALPEGVEFIKFPEIDTQFDYLEQINPKLEAGVIPEAFDDLVARIASKLAPILENQENLIVHNLFTKHF